MKNKLSIMLACLLIFPYIASASWWNPFSWKFFSRTAEKKEIQVIPTQMVSSSITSTTSIELDQHVLCNGNYYSKCPEEQLLVCPTDGKSDAYCSIPKTPKLRTESPTSKNSPTPKKVAVTPKSPVSTPITPTPQSTSTEENFAPTLEIAVSGEVESLFELAKLIYKYDEIFDGRISFHNKLISLTEPFLADNDVNFRNVIIAGNNVIENENQLIKARKESGHKVAADIESKAYALKSFNTGKKYISRENFIAEMENLKQIDVYWDNAHENFNKIRSSYEEDIADFDAMHNTIFSNINIYLTMRGSQAISKPTYTAPVISPVSIPQSSRTYCNVYNGNTVNCETYSN